MPFRSDWFELAIGMLTTYTFSFSSSWLWLSSGSQLNTRQASRRRCCSCCSNKCTLWSYFWIVSLQDSFWWSDSWWCLEIHQSGVSGQRESCHNVERNPMKAGMWLGGRRLALHVRSRWFTVVQTHMYPTTWCAFWGVLHRKDYWERWVLLVGWDFPGGSASVPGAMDVLVEPGGRSIYK